MALARALMNGGRVIIADEPTGALDTEQGREILELLAALAERGHTVIVASHDAATSAHALRRIELGDGRIARDTGSDQPPPGHNGSRRVRSGRIAAWPSVG